MSDSQTTADIIDAIQRSGLGLKDLERILQKAKPADALAVSHPPTQTQHPHCAERQISVDATPPTLRCFGEPKGPGITHTRIKSLPKEIYRCDPVQTHVSVNGHASLDEIRRRYRQELGTRNADHEDVASDMAGYMSTLKKRGQREARPLACLGCLGIEGPQYPALQPLLLEICGRTTWALELDMNGRCVLIILRYTDKRGSPHRYELWQGPRRGYADGYGLVNMSGKTSDADWVEHGDDEEISVITPGSMRTSVDSSAGNIPPSGPTTRARGSSGANTGNLLEEQTHSERVKECVNGRFERGDILAAIEQATVLPSRSEASSSGLQRTNKRKPCKSGLRQRTTKSRRTSHGSAPDPPAHRGEDIDESGGSISVDRPMTTYRSLPHRGLDIGESDIDCSHDYSTELLAAFWAELRSPQPRTGWRNTRGQLRPNMQTLSWLLPLEASIQTVYFRPGSRRFGFKGSRPYNMEAFLMQLCGTEMSDSDMCVQCRRGFGPFTHCRVKEMMHYGSCANCVYNKGGSLCSKRDMSCNSGPAQNNNQPRGETSSQDSNLPNEETSSQDSTPPRSVLRRRRARNIRQISDGTPTVDSATPPAQDDVGLPPTARNTSETSPWPDELYRVSPEYAYKKYQATVESVDDSTCLENPHMPEVNNVSQDLKEQSSPQTGAESEEPRRSASLKAESVSTTISGSPRLSESPVYLPDFRRVVLICYLGDSASGVRMRLSNARTLQDLMTMIATGPFRRQIGRVDRIAGARVQVADDTESYWLLLDSAEDFDAVVNDVKRELNRNGEAEVAVRAWIELLG